MRLKVMASVVGCAAIVLAGAAAVVPSFASTPQGQGQSTWAWGYDNGGALSPAPVQSSGFAGATALTVGLDSGGFASGNNYAIMGDGTVRAQGPNARGQVGDGSTLDRAAPVPVKNLANVTAVTARGASAFAVESDGSVWAWGANDQGQLGLGDALDHAVPQKILGLPGIRSVTSYFNRNFAVGIDGTVWAWGDNGQGQLGIGSTTGTTVPAKITGLSDIKAITTNFNGVFAVSNAGAVWSWGRNHRGILGNGTDSDALIPTAVPDLNGTRSVVAGPFAAYAIAADGTVRSWGANSAGVLGTGDTTTVYVNAPTRLPGLDNVASIFTQSRQGTTAYAVKTDGTLWAWGLNQSGELGTGTTTSNAVAAAVPGATGIVSVNALANTLDGHDYSSVTSLKSDGTVLAWGVSSRTPVAVPQVTGVVQLGGDGFVNVALSTAPMVTPTPTSPTATPPVTNRPPAFVSYPTKTVYPGSRAFTVTASDPDGQPVTIAWSQLPLAPVRVTCTMAPDAIATAACTMTPSSGINTTNDITFTASDGHGGTAKVVVNVGPAFYVGIGDSYSSGEGNPPFDAGTDAAFKPIPYEAIRRAVLQGNWNQVGRLLNFSKPVPNSCHRSPSSWQRKLDVSIHYAMEKHVACSQADSKAMQEPFKETDSQLETLKHLNPQPDLIVLTAGGNDAGFGTMVGACYLAGHTGACPAAIAFTDYQIARTLPSKLTALYDKIHKAAPQSKILVVGYPNIVGNGVTSTARCPWIDRSNLNLMRRTAARMDSALASTVAKVAAKDNISYVSTLDALRGHELCTGDSWVRAIHLEPPYSQTGAYANSAHPNARGQEAIRDVVAAYINRNLE